MFTKTYPDGSKFGPEHLFVAFVASAAMAGATFYALEKYKDWKEIRIARRHG